MKTLSKLKACIVVAIALCTISSCDDDTAQVGSTVMPSADNQTVAQAVYNVVTNSVRVDSVLSNSTTSYFGRIIDPETNAMTTSEFIAQYAVLENFGFPTDSLMYKDTAGRFFVDSVTATLYISSFYGDSLNAMQIGFHQLDKNNVPEETENYYTTLDPTRFTDYSEGSIHQVMSYTARDLTQPKSALDSIYYYGRYIRTKLPVELGNDIINKYYSNPEYFKNSYRFIRNVFPGFYFKVEGGVGTMLNISGGAINLHYHYHFVNSNGTDTVVNVQARMAATQEVLQINSIENSGIDQLVADTTFTMLKTPTAIFTEVTLPVEEIYASHETDTINSAKISFPRLYSTVESEYNLTMPTYLLMVKKSKMQTFFEDEEVADGYTSYISAFSSTDNAYTFTNIATLISSLRNDRKEAAGITAADNAATIAAKYATHDAANPDWNKVVLVPVEATYYTNQTTGTTTLLQVRNSLGLNSTRLLRGDGTDKLQISVIYSHFEK